MITFKAAINSILGQPGIWNYYADKSIEFEDPFKNHSNARKFIKNYIKLSGKSSGNLLVEEIEKLEDYRVLHIVSTFFLGLYLHKESKYIRDILNQKTKFYKIKWELSSDVQFCFIWFLLCLFHDLGSFFEDNEVANLTEFSDFFSDNRFVKLSTPVGVPRFYGKNHKRYFKLRSEVDKKYDHGIYGGYTMFRELSRIRETEFGTINQNNLSSLNWEPQLQKIYNLAAWVILGHNIWYVTNDNNCRQKAYEYYKLKDFEFSTYQFKILLRRHPFFFLFCLIDSIEPLKRVRDFNMLDKVFIELGDRSLTLSTSLTCGCHDIILGHAESLNKWLCPATRNVDSVEVFFSF